MAEEQLRVEVAFALPDKQMVLTVDVPPGCSVSEAIERSGIYDQQPQARDLAVAVGIFGKVVKKPEQEPVRDGDRIELYRPLIIDPNQARANRAKKRSG